MNKSQILMTSTCMLFAAGCTPSTVASLGADAVYTGSESRSVQEVLDDNGIKLILNKELIGNDLGLFKDVSTVIYKRTAYLLGTVADPEAKARAGAIAGAIVKIRHVVNLLQITDDEGLEAYVEDLVLEKRIQSAILFDADIRSANFRIRSVLGTVYVIGTAADQAELDRVQDLVRSFEGVNDIQVYASVS